MEPAQNSPYRLSQEQETQQQLRVKPGPLRRLDTRMTAVMLEQDLIAWGKRQPGGLSRTVRRLLRAAMSGVPRDPEAGKLPTETNP